MAVISGATTITDYISGIQYNGNGTTDTLSFIPTEEGRALHNGTTYDYQYYLGDNLGNTRITFNSKTGAAVTIQQDDYYPFGWEISQPSLPLNPKNEYLYNKKELQEEFTEYDYGARFYDPLTVHWTSVDPLAEVSRRWSPYNYVEDNPIRFTDPDGMLCYGCSLPTWIENNFHGFYSNAGSSSSGPPPPDWVKKPNGQTVYDPKIHSTKQAIKKYGANSEDVSGQVRTEKGTGILYRFSPANSPTPWVRPALDLMENSGHPENLWHPWKGAEALGQFGDVMEGVTWAIGTGLGAIETGIAARSSELWTNTVYEGFDRVTGEVKYVGITARDVAERWGEHWASGSEKALLDFRVVEGATGLSRIGARVWEQSLINEYELGNLLNKINSIAPKYWGGFGL